MDNQIELHFHPMDKDNAHIVLGWKYPPPYDFYNPNPENLGVDITYLTEPKYPYFTITDHKGKLLAFCTYGLDAQVPGGNYSREALDIGLGLHPDLTGRGYGIRFVNEVLEYGLQKYQPETCRVTIAKFNQRAQRVWEKAGFQFDHEFKRPSDNTLFVVLLRSEKSLHEN
jgi:RimJ/RimL family protein N-acetyltransferase